MVGAQVDTHAHAHRFTHASKIPTSGYIGVCMVGCSMHVSIRLCTYYLQRPLFVGLHSLSIGIKFTTTDPAVQLSASSCSCHQSLSVGEGNVIEKRETEKAKKWLLWQRWPFKIEERGLQLTAYAVDKGVEKERERER